MYSEHPSFPQPDLSDTPVWRYMDFTKLLALLDTRSVYFPRADKLGDPFEGSWPKRNVEGRQIIPPEIPKEAAENYTRAMQGLADMSKAWTTYCAVSCWHLSEYESAAMWNLYLSANEGIAIRSTYENLRDSIIDEEPVFVGMVRYIDYDRDVIQNFNLLEPYAHKRKSFEHEREVRAVVLRVPDFADPEHGREPVIEHGIALEVDVERLISDIYVSPASPAWFRDLVESVVRRYRFDFPVFRSDIDRQPVY